MKNYGRLLDFARDDIMKMPALSPVEVSVVITVLNEEQNISILLNALMKQSRKPDEIILVDGGSLDTTVSKISNFKSRQKLSHLGGQVKIKFFLKKGNRSVGRNYGVSKAKHEQIAFTDAGCVPDKDWLSELEKAASSGQKVVAGYYYGLAKNNFQEAVLPYVLVMPDRVDPDNFLPATRSMLINKKVFKKLKGFDENLSDNEDYEFAKRIKSAGLQIKFANKAKVAWMPSENIFEFSKMIFRFARGDTYAKIFRPKVALIFLRYLLLVILSIYLFWHLKFSIWNLFEIWILLFVFYIIWSVLKNKKYVKRGWYYLPILQIVSDFAVMTGSLLGFLSF